MFFAFFLKSPTTGLHFGNDPFIPPRGRKHNLPDLDALLQRYETFVPNRGRRDKIKDIFKHDDLFYPNRGKRQMMLPPPPSLNDNNGIGGDDIDSGSDNIKATSSQHQHHHQSSWLMNDENAATTPKQLTQPHPLHPVTVEAAAAAALQSLEENVMAEMKRKLQQQQDSLYFPNSFDEMSNKLGPRPTTKMSSTYQSATQQQQQQRLDKRLKSMANILQQRQQKQQQHNNKNSRRQWWKRYSGNDRPAAAAVINTSSRSRTGAANRLHALRSMSVAGNQWQQQDPSPSGYFSPTTNKFMGHRFRCVRQSLAQQFDPLSWHKLQMLQHQYHLPLLWGNEQRQLTRN